ncbi:MAG: DGQHR domain-containing protein [Bacteroidetes bacterium]|nr:DGQHR domain-containing protein [Bacteroidota bacterium]
MVDNNTIIINCIEVCQPIGKFYVGKITWQNLLDISYSDIRRIQKEELGAIDSYLGIQRELSPNRLKEIAKYVSFSDATFPSSIVLSIKSIDKETDEPNILGYDNATGTLTLNKSDKIAQIIDGQHRVFGIQKFIENNHLFNKTFVFDLIVTLFIDIDPDEESMIFSTINKAQTKVNKSLVYDLFDLAKTRSPQRTAHNLVKLLDEKAGSPLFGMVKRLGVANDVNRETITQATLVECILNYISNDGEEMKDRDILMRGKKLDLISGKELERRFFRNWFIEEKDAQIAKLLWDYFLAIKKRWPQAWENKSILVKSTGIIALMKFLAPIVNHLGVERNISVEEFSKIFDSIEIDDNEFNTTKYIPGVKGQSELYKDLINSSGLNKIILTDGICKRPHRFDSIFAELPESQKFYTKDVRHKCAGCAFDQGYEDAIKGITNGIRLDELDISQAGTVRHKDPIEAYNMGYRSGLKSKNK